MRRFLIFSICAVALAIPGAQAAGTPVGTFKGCPQAVLSLPLPSAAYARAAVKVVLRFIHTTSAPKALKLPGAFVNRVLRVRDWLPSGWVKTECGLKVWQRSLAVEIRLFRALDNPHNPAGRCNSCARITLLISKTRHGWIVWGIY